MLTGILALFVNGNVKWIYRNFCFINFSLPFNTWETGVFCRIILSLHVRKISVMIAKSQALFSAGTVDAWVEIFLSNVGFNFSPANNKISVIGIKGPQAATTKLGFPTSMDCSLQYNGICLLHGVAWWWWFRWRCNVTSGLLWYPAGTKLGMDTNIL